MHEIPQILASFAFFGAVFVCPLVFMLMRHQRAMAEVIHGGTSNEALRRIEALEREVMELRSARADQMLRTGKSPDSLTLRR